MGSHPDEWNCGVGQGGHTGKHPIEPDSRFMLVISLILASCLAAMGMRLPDLRPIGDGRNWMLVEPLVYRIDFSVNTVIVPRGFVTDFAGIPQAFQSLIQPDSPLFLPAIVHDFLYWDQGCTRRQSDSLFLLALTEMEVPRPARNEIYFAVRAFGQRAWDANARDRAAGLPRFVPDSGVRAPQPREAWSEYRVYLQRAGSASRPGNTVPPSACSRGGPA